MCVYRNVYTLAKTVMKKVIQLQCILNVLHPKRTQRTVQNLNTTSFQFLESESSQHDTLNLDLNVKCLYGLCIVGVSF